MERSILLRLYAASNKAGQVVERAAAAAGTTGEDHAFLAIVALHEPVTPTAIAREFGLSLSTVLFRAARNVDLGHVERTANPRDRRSVHLRLTSEGHRVWERVAGELFQAMVRLLDDLGRPADEYHRALTELEGALERELAGAEADVRP